MGETRVFEASGGVWAQLRVEAMQAAAEEPLLASYLHASILHHDRIEDALSYHLAQKLGHGDLPALQAVQADPPLQGSQFAGDALEQRRFAGAVGADDGQQTAGSDFATQVVHGGMPVVAERQIVKVEQRLSLQGRAQT